MQDRGEQIRILEALAQGIDPVSGELFDKDSPYGQVEVVRALYGAIGIMRVQMEKGNRGMPWTEEEEALLVEEFGKGLSTAQMAQVHGRSAGAIRSRLIRLGLVNIE